METKNLQFDLLHTIAAAVLQLPECRQGSHHPPQLSQNQHPLINAFISQWIDLALNRRSKFNRQKKGNRYQAHRSEFPIEDLDSSRRKIEIKEFNDRRNENEPEMLEDEVDDESNVETLVIGGDYYAVFVLPLLLFLLLHFSLYAETLEVSSPWERQLFLPPATTDQGDGIVFPSFFAVCLSPKFSFLFFFLKKLVYKKFIPKFSKQHRFIK